MFHRHKQQPRLIVHNATAKQQDTVAAWFADLFELPRLAHHPACRFWSNHLVWVSGRPLCLGCTCMSAGMVSGALVLYPLAAWWLSPLQLFCAGLLLYLPTIAQIYYQRYAFKVASRFMLGIGVVLALGAALFGHPWQWPELTWNVSFLAIFAILLVGTIRWRSRRLDVPCQRCPEGQFPFCSWRLPQLESAVNRQRTDPAYLPTDLATFVEVVSAQLAHADPHAHDRVQFVATTTCDHNAPTPHDLDSPRARSTSGTDEIVQRPR